MTTKEVREAVCEREGIMEDSGYSPHHCFWRSEYKKEDFDEEWNVEPIRFALHEKIHNGDRHLEVYYKKKALLRYTGKHKVLLEKILKQKICN
jgi:hypothetical protein